MARYRDDRDDDEEDEDDRPRRRKKRRRDDDAPPKSNLPVILLVVGLAVGLPLLVCAGVGLWGFLSVKDAVQQEMAGDEATSAADSFFEALSRDDVTTAYQSHTTDAFRTGTSKEAFTKRVKAHPILTTTHWASAGNPPKPVGKAPNRTVTLTYTVSPDDEFDEDMEADDAPRGRPMAPGRPVVPGRPIPPAGPKAAKLQTVTCTLVVAEQPNGTWKVDQFTIP